MNANSKEAVQAHDVTAKSDTQCDKFVFILRCPDDLNVLSKVKTGNVEPNFIENSPLKFGELC